MGNGIFKITYTPDKKQSSFCKDENGNPLVYLSADKVRKVRAVINGFEKYLIYVEDSVPNFYLIEGNNLIVNHINSLDQKENWCFRICSGTENGLETIAQKIGLPLF